MASSSSTKSNEERIKFSESSCKISSASKRKASISTVAEMLRNTRMKNMKLSENSTNHGVNMQIPLRSESDYKEPIIYDEYLERGIPDKLLEGLGLNSNSETETVNGFEEETEEKNLKTSHENASDKSAGSAAFCILTPIPVVLYSSGDFLSTALQDQIPEASEVLPCMGEHKVSGKRSMLCSSDNKLTTSVKRLPICEHTRHNRKRLLAHSPRSLPKSDDVSETSHEPDQWTDALPHYAIKRGGVMYEYTRSGAVLASIIRDNIAPNEQFSQDHVLSGKSTPTELDSLPSEYPDDCGFSAANVENLLDDLFKEMESMRRKLLSMKDDLRRVGVKSDVKTDVRFTKEQSEKATEVSVRIQKLYTEHVQLLECVERSEQNDRVEKENDGS